MTEVTSYVTYSIGPGAWYHLPDTDVEIFIHSGPMTNMSVRKRIKKPVPTLPETERVVKKNATP